MNITTIKNALYAWASSNAGGTTVVWADQAVPRPPRPYIVLRLNGPFRVAGADEIRPTTTPGVPEVTGHRRLVLSVQVHGTGIEQKANDLNLSLNKQSVLALFRIAGISVINEGDITNLTEYLETKFEELYAFDIELLVTALMTDSSGYILTTEVSGLGETQIIGD